MAVSPSRPYGSPLSLISSHPALKPCSSELHWSSHAGGFGRRLSDGASMDCFSRQSIRPPRPHCPSPCHVSPHPTMCSGPSTSPATHSFPPIQITSLSSPQGPNAKFLASVKLDCSLPEPGVGLSVQKLETELAAIRINPCSLKGTSSKLHSPCFGSISLPLQPGAGAAIPENDPSQASRKNQWGIMIIADHTEESHQLSAPDRVAGRMDLKLNGDVAPPSQMTHVTDNISESRRQEAVIHSSLIDAFDQLPEVKAVECCEGTGTPSPNVEIISSLIDVSGCEICAMGLFLRLFPEMLPVDGDPTGSSEVGFSIEACNVGLDAATLSVGVHDADTPPGPLATLFDHHISGPCAEFLLMLGVGRDCRMASSGSQLKGAGSCGRPFCWVVASSQ
ncbi:hypothetical protein Nepgr_003865 [Nepenthes gracilis]|uniref:Uncharacterized protein n=1 Tax=Nepenthes gracilis TaxID=150966 RepID=A0AAD3XEK4_NEPGR|nr:hypothetical protein Nepgr_003865 [Nepenthes gracilis]